MAKPCLYMYLFIQNIKLSLSHELLYNFVVLSMRF